MPETTLNVMAVVGSTHQNSVTRVVVEDRAARLKAHGCAVDVLDLQKEPLALYNPDTAYEAPGFKPLKARVLRANVYVLGTPDYHGCISSALKNFLDHFWQEFSGKLFATLVASHEKGLTVTDQIRTAVRQCYGWSLPYGASFVDKEDVKDGKIVTDALNKRLEMMARDVKVYGELLAQQRQLDLKGTDPGFMARQRK